MAFSNIRRMFGMIHVTETPTIISVEGVTPNTMVKNIYRLWQTSKIAKFMFTDIGKSRFKFPSFFAPDVLYMLQQIEADRYAHNKREMRQIIAALQEQTWLKSLEETHPSIMNYNKLSVFNADTKPMPSQQEFMEHYDVNKQKYGLDGYLLAADPGTGKTLSSLFTFECLECDLIVAVVPKRAVKDVWERTLHEKYRKVPEYWSSADGKPFESGQRYYIVHYEALGAFLEFSSGLHGSNVGVVLDESHNMNELTANRTQQFIKLCSQLKATNVIWASGTPMKAIGAEAIPFFMTVDKRFNADAQERFKKIFGRDAKRANDILRNHLGLTSFRVSKSEVVENNTQTHTIQVQTKDSAQFSLDAIKKEMKDFITERTAYYRKNTKYYETVYKDALAQFERTLKSSEAKADFKQYLSYIKTIRGGYDAGAMKEETVFCNKYENSVIMPALTPNLRPLFKDAKSVYKYVELKIRGECLGRILGKRRTECNVSLVPDPKGDRVTWTANKKPVTLLDIVEDAEKKTVIFSSFVPVVDRLKNYFESQGLKPLVVYGDTNKNLPSIVKEFDESEANPLIATYQSLSTAVPLTMANTAIMMNAPFRTHDYQQATARVDRKGQDAQVNIWNVYLDTGDEPNISTRSQEIMAWSKEQVDSIMGIKGADTITVESIMEEIYTEWVPDPTRTTWGSARW